MKDGAEPRVGGVTAKRAGEKINGKRVAERKVMMEMALCFLTIHIVRSEQI